MKVSANTLVVAGLGCLLSLATTAEADCSGNHSVAAAAAAVANEEGKQAGEGRTPSFLPSSSVGRLRGGGLLSDPQTVMDLAGPTSFQLETMTEEEILDLLKTFKSSMVSLVGELEGFDMSSVPDDVANLTEI